MAWLKAIGSSIYAYGAIAITILLALVGYQNKKIKRETKRADNAEHNEKLLIKVRDVERDIDEQKANDEAQARLKQLRDIKDLGDITNEIESLSTDELIDNISRMLDDNKVQNNRDTSKVSD